MEFHSEDDIPFPKIKFINQPDTFGYKVVGEIYQQTGPFQRMEHDWNQDGDIYPEKIAGFQKITAANEYAHSYIYLSERDFADLMSSDCIEYVKQPERALQGNELPKNHKNAEKSNPSGNRTPSGSARTIEPDTIKNLIRAMVAYGMEFTWSDSEIIDALVSLGITYEDFCRVGARDFVRSYFEDNAEKYPIDLLNSRDIDIADRNLVEQEIWSLLEHTERKNARELGANSPYYKKAKKLLGRHCSCVFPDLYDIFSNSSSDLLFRDGEKYEYTLFHYNPDSSAGGQIVQCPFSEEQAARMVHNEDYIDVLAENTQYLYDINDICFFDCVFYLLDLKTTGHYLGNNVDTVCQEITAQNKENTTPTLSSKIAFAEVTAAEGQASSDISREFKPER